jgi:hypothetical protein
MKKRSSTVLAAGTLALGVAHGSAAAAHTEKPITRLHEIRAAYLALRADRQDHIAGGGGKAAKAARDEERLAQSWQDFPNFPNWGNVNNWSNGWQNY